MTICDTPTVYFCQCPNVTRVYGPRYGRGGGGDAGILKSSLACSASYRLADQVYYNYVKCGRLFNFKSARLPPYEHSASVVWVQVCVCVCVCTGMCVHVCVCEYRYVCK